MIATQIIKDTKKQKSNKMLARLEQIKKSRKVSISLYVNGILNSRVNFTRKNRKIRGEQLWIRIPAEMDNCLYSDLIADFRELSKRLGFDFVLVVGDKLTAENEIARTNLETIMAYAHDALGNKITLCYNVIL